MTVTVETFGKILADLVSVYIEENDDLSRMPRTQAEWVTLARDRGNEEAATILEEHEWHSVSINHDIVWLHFADRKERLIDRLHG